MSFNSELFSFYLPIWALIAIGFSVSFLITYIGIPSVIRIARVKNLYDVPGTRTSHMEPTPRLGGAMIFAGVIISSVLFTDLNSANDLKYIIAGMIVLAFLGLKDDIVSLATYKKAIGQFIAAFIIVIPGDMHLTTFSGHLNNHELEVAGNLFLTLLLVMTLINSINFIDGIDGLASGVGIIASTIFGGWNLYVQQSSMAQICFVLAGALLAFFYYNVFSKKNKIFLGDTGSMLIGFLLSVFMINFLVGNSLNISSGIALKSAKAISLSIIFVPIFDTMRICVIRIYNGKSIFKADCNHVHHKVLRMSKSHLRATLTIIMVNLLIILSVFIFRNLGNKVLFIILIALGIIFSIVLGRDQ